MTLRDLFDDKALPDVRVSGVTQNSKEAQEGSLFFAVKGETSDGNAFIDDVIKQGASAVVTQNAVEKEYPVPVIRVENIDKAMARAACKFYDNPSEKIFMCGITGTKGKTSISYLLESILFEAKRRPAVLGTINYRINGEVLCPAPNTTPVALTLQKVLSQAVEDNCDCTVMEISSHALELGRVRGINFDAAAFTNLQRDHMDFHKNFDNYFAAKYKLFENLINPKNTKKTRAAVINIDDDYGRKLQKMLEGKTKIITYSMQSKADFCATDINPSLEGVFFRLNGKAAHINLLGAHNVYNALAAAALASVMGVDLETSLKGVGALKGVCGRMERVDLGQDFYVFVDFAYTNEALLKAYETLAPYKKGRLITVFGCGGQRDTTKRPLMGASAAKHSDLVLLTKDNPRKEDQNQIFRDILAGMPDYYNYKIIPSRKEAICEAIRTAKKGDIILIAGKGHENYQILPSGKIHFSDRQEAEEGIKKYVFGQKV